MNSIFETVIVCVFGHLHVNLSIQSIRQPVSQTDIMRLISWFWNENRSFSQKHMQRWFDYGSDEFDQNRSSIHCM